MNKNLFGIKLYYKYEISDTEYSEVCRFIFQHKEDAEFYIPAYLHRVSNIEHPLLGKLIPSRTEIIDFCLYD